MKYNHITLSGKICTGKSTIVSLLQKRLGWDVYSTGKHFRKKAEKEGLSLYFAEEQNNTDTRNADEYVVTLLNEKKSYIIDAWLGGYLARNIKEVYKVYLTADITTRLRRYALRENISLKKAEKQINEREQYLISKLEKIYNTDDFFNSNHYNMVFQTDRVTPAQIVETIIKELHI